MRGMESIVAAALQIKGTGHQGGKLCDQLERLLGLVAAEYVDAFEAMGYTNHTARRHVLDQIAERFDLNVESLKDVRICENCGGRFLVAPGTDVAEVYCDGYCEKQAKVIAEREADLSEAGAR